MIIKKSAANVCCAPRAYGSPFFWGDAVPSGIGCPLGCGDGMGQGGSVQEHVEMLGGTERSGLPGEERLLGASSRKIRHRGHAPVPGCAKTASFQGGDGKGRAVPVPPSAPPRPRSPLKAHLGRQESIHLVVEGVKEETQRLPADAESGAQPRWGGHPAQGLRSPRAPFTC